MESAKNSGATTSKRNPKCPGLETQEALVFFVCEVFFVHLF
jgi:hypothetical protein